MSDVSPGESDGTPSEEVRQEIAAILRTDTSQLGIAFRAIEADPDITPSQMADRTSIANPGAAGNIRQALLAILERQIPRSPSIAQQTSGRAGGLLRHPALSREATAYLRALRRDLDRAAKSRPTRWSSEVVNQEDRPGTLDRSNTTAGPPSEEVRQEIAAILRTDTSQLGIAFRAIEADPDITPSQMADRTSIANPGAAGNIRQALLAILERQIPRSPSIAQQASGRAGGLLRHPALSGEATAYLRALRRDLDRAAKSGSSRWRAQAPGVGTDDSRPDRNAATEPDAAAVPEAAAQRLTDLVNLEVLLENLADDPSLPAKIREHIKRLMRALQDEATRSAAAQSGNADIQALPNESAASGMGTGLEVERTAFISYSRRDVDAANELLTELEAAGIRTWIDYGAIRPGASWAGAISEAIASADVLIVLISSDSVQSNHVETEVSLAVSDETLVIPVRLDDSAISGGLRYFLHRFNWVEAIQEPRQPVFSALARQVYAMRRS